MHPAEDEFVSADNVQKILMFLTKFFQDKYGITLADRVGIQDVMNTLVVVQKEVLSRAKESTTAKELFLQTLSLMKQRLVAELKMGESKELPPMPGSGEIVSAPVPAPVPQSDSQMVTSDDILSEEVFQAKLQQISGGREALPPSRERPATFWMVHAKDRPWLQETARNPFRVAKGSTRPVEILRVQLPPRMSDSPFLHIHIQTSDKGEILLHCPLEWTNGSYRPLTQRMAHVMPDVLGEDWIVSIRYPSGDLVPMGDDGYSARGAFRQIEVSMGTATRPPLIPHNDRVIFWPTGTPESAASSHVIREVSTGPHPSIMLLQVDPPLPGNNEEILRGNVLFSTQQPFVYFGY